MVKFKVSGLVKYTTSSSRKYSLLMEVLSDEFKSNEIWSYVQFVHPSSAMVLLSSHCSLGSTIPLMLHCVAVKMKTQKSSQ